MALQFGVSSSAKVMLESPAHPPSLWFAHPNSLSLGNYLARRPQKRLVIRTHSSLDSYKLLGPEKQNKRFRSHLCERVIEIIVWIENISKW